MPGLGVGVGLNLGLGLGSKRASQCPLLLFSGSGWNPPVKAICNQRPPGTWPMDEASGLGQ